MDRLDYLLCIGLDTPAPVPMGCILKGLVMVTSGILNGSLRIKDNCDSDNEAYLS